MSAVRHVPVWIVRGCGSRAGGTGTTSLTIVLVTTAYLDASVIERAS